MRISDWSSDVCASDLPVPYGQCAEPGTLAFSARRIVIDPAIRPLLGRLLRLDTMIVEGAALDLPSTDSPFELPTWPEVLPDIDPPLGLQADTIQIDDFRQYRPDKNLLAIRRVRGGPAARAGTPPPARCWAGCCGWTR